MLRSLSSPTAADRKSVEELLRLLLLSLLSSSAFAECKFVKELSSLGLRSLSWTKGCEHVQVTRNRPLWCVQKFFALWKSWLVESTARSAEVIPTKTNSRCCQDYYQSFFFATAAICNSSNKCQGIHIPAGGLGEVDDKSWLHLVGYSWLVEEKVHEAELQMPMKPDSHCLFCNCLHLFWKVYFFGTFLFLVLHHYLSSKTSRHT